MSVLLFAAALQILPLPRVPTLCELLPPGRYSHRLVFECASGSYAFTYGSSHQSGGRLKIGVVEHGGDPEHLVPVDMAANTALIHQIEVAGEVEGVTGACLANSGVVIVHIANGSKRPTFRVEIGRASVTITPM